MFLGISSELSLVPTSACERGGGGYGVGRDQVVVVRVTTHRIFIFINRLSNNRHLTQTTDIFLTDIFVTCYFYNCLSQMSDQNINTFTIFVCVCVCVWRVRGGGICVRFEFPVWIVWPTMFESSSYILLFVISWHMNIFPILNFGLSCSQF